MDVMQQPTLEEIRSEMTTDRIHASDTEEDEEILAIIRGKFRDRQVDWKVRNNDGTLQYACDYYHDRELFGAVDWHRFDFVGITESGNKIQWARSHGGGQVPFEEWVDSTGESHLEDELGEIWNHVKQMNNDT